MIRWAHYSLGGREEGTGVTTTPDFSASREAILGGALTGGLLRRKTISPRGRSTLGRQGAWSRRGERHDVATTTLRVGAAGKPRTEGFD
jgi:hypothetical protein